LNEIERNVRTAISPADSASEPRRRFVARRALAFAMLLVLPIAAQSPGLPGGSPVNRGRQQQQPDLPDSGFSGDQRIEAVRIAKLNLIRHKSMISDADKLLRLAQELNNDANADSSALSPSERMHKAAEIGKLAKDVREKMAFTIGTPQETATPFNVLTR
jgi:hypothetical protein